MIKKIANKLGIDKAIMYTSAARIFQGLGSIISVLLVARFLTGVEQGFYYTFASILAIQVFFELGLNGIITQYVAHEVSHLKQFGDKYEGSEKHLSRMASLLNFCIKWYTLLAGGLFVILLVSGFVFFGHYYKAEAKVVWQLPWVFLSITTILHFLMSPFVAFIEGLGKVKEVAKIRLIQQLVSMIFVWGALLGGLKLYAGAVSAFIGVSILIYLITRGFLPILRNLRKVIITERVSYKGEIFPFQWKIALSWVSGYFIFQLFNPVLFATEGAVVAGQMGMTLAALNAILNFTLSWFSTKVPIFSGHIASKNYEVLDKLFNRTMWQSTIINIFGLIFVLIVIFCIRYFNIELGGKNLGERFLPYTPMIFMMVTITLNHVVAAWATYLRCHKREPMLVQSVTMGVLCSLSTIFLGKYFGVIGMTAGYMSLCIIGFIWTYFIFIINKRNWHNE